MWTILGVSVTAGLITLRSMRSLVHTPLPSVTQNSSTQPQTIEYTHYLILHKEELSSIITTVIRQLHHIRTEITIEVLILPGQTEYILYIPSSVILSQQQYAALLPIGPIWSEQYIPDYVVDDAETIYNSVLAHQIILHSKTHNLAYLTTRGIKRTPASYRISGIDEYKWKQFVQKQSDHTPDLIPHDRIYNLIQEKSATY